MDRGLEGLKGSDLTAILLALEHRSLEHGALALDREILIYDAEDCTTSSSDNPVQPFLIAYRVSGVGNYGWSKGRLMPDVDMIFCKKHPIWRFTVTAKLFPCRNSSGRTRARRTRFTSTAFPVSLSPTQFIPSSFGTNQASWFRTSPREICSKDLVNR